MWRDKLLSLLIWSGTAAVFLVLSASSIPFPQLPSGMDLAGLLGFLAVVMVGTELLSLLTMWWMVFKQKPAVEGAMINRLYKLLAVIAAAVVVTYSIGRLASFTTFFTLFGGMLLGWSLQAPVSGFAAFLLVSLKRPFRPGDRVQFPNLGLTGDIQEIGPMYTVLNQVGGSIGSEEAVGRFILVPNAMLFSQVAINYTMKQEAAYILDEVVIRVTYDSNWSVAEKLLLEAAREVTADIIAATGVEPYIRSDLYDYGVYMRLRYMTRVKDRPAISYEISKRIFSAFQKEQDVDFAIPYVYSYKAGAVRKEEERSQDPAFRHIMINKIKTEEQPKLDPHDIEMLMASIEEKGLLQPIVVAKPPGADHYEILAGHLRFEAAKRLGWKSIPALVRQYDNEETA
ncbi:MAG TPA: ParB N-terminal domain-containing protein [Firmicutes bacterium]|nr:ParB N-terminal domain-containing protein [Bacillota bacterium]